MVVSAMKLLSISVCLAAVVGCSSAHFHDQAELFRAKHPDLAQGYLVLAPVSAEYIEYIRPDEQVLRSAVIVNLERAKRDPARIDRWLEYLTRVEARAQKDRAQWISVTNRIRKTDSMYFFEYHTRIGDASYGDCGLLVLRDGNIVYRSTFSAGFSGSSNAATNAECPVDGEIDKL